MLVSPSIAYQNLLIRLSNQHTTLPQNRNSTATFHQTSRLQKHSKRDSCPSTWRETVTSFPQMALSTPSILSTSVHKFNSLSLYRHKLSPRFFSVAASSNNGVFTSPETAKSFDFTAEERIYNWWESQGYFKPNTESGGDPFVISMPPPNVTGSLHMGHAMFVTLEDIMVRYFRMKGRPTLWVPGTDHAGIATQLVVERMLASEGIKRVDLGREEFNKRVLEWKAKYGGTITEQIKRLGASCDWSRERFTLDDQLSSQMLEIWIKTMSICFVIPSRKTSNIYLSLV